MSPDEAFERALAGEMAGGSNFRLALEAVGGSTRTLAAEMGVSQRTVQRWAAYERGEAGKEARNPERSPMAGEIRAMADAQREERALERLDNMRAFESDSADVNYEDEDGEDEGARRAQTMAAPLNLRPVTELFRQGGSRAEVGAAFARALGDSYGLPASLVISNVEGLVLH